jgi:hypothetical protein
MVMDVFVVDIPPKFGMLLSRSWAEKLKDTLQMDISYATMPVFHQEKRLYREVLLKYMVSSKDHPNNCHTNSIDIDIESIIFYNDLCIEEDDQNVSKDQQIESVSGEGEGVWIIPPDANTNSKLCCYKLASNCTNKIVEYEALILGLGILRDLRDKKIYVHGDSELIINQVKDNYKTKHLRMRAYRNIVFNLHENISEYNILVVPRENNCIEDVLST